jgi:aryl-alcohol dehydrogenase (NADP+)
MPWSPLARGFLAGNRTRGGGGATARSQSDAFARSLYYGESDFAVAERVGQVAGRRGVSAAQMALAWLLRRPGVTAPIIGATRMLHLEEAVAALDLSISDDECAELEAPYEPHRVLGHE